MVRSRLAAVPLSLVLATGCLTPQMGHAIEEQLDLALGPGVQTTRRPGTVGALSTFDKDASLPRRLWYLDPVSRIYHERRTNTFVLWDVSHRGWIAVSRAAAFSDDFQASRAQVLVEGAPAEVERCLDRIQDLEPDWHGERTGA